MGAPSETYVDPSIAANSGTGTIGDPYGDLQYALDTMTRDSTNGDRINIKSGTAEVLTGSIDLTSYGTTSFTAPIIFSGYTSAAGDGGIGEIDGNATYSVVNNSAYENMFFINLRMGNCGSSDVLLLDRFVGAYNCEIYGTSGDGFRATGGYTDLIRCWIHNIGGRGVYSTTSHYRIIGCYFSNDGGNSFTAAIQQSSVNSVTVVNNFFNLDSTSEGIGVNNWGVATVLGNSLLTSGTGRAIFSNSLGSGPFINNLIEGFSEGIDTLAAGGSNGVLPFALQNAFYDCTTDISSDREIVLSLDNESLVSSPFKKTGSLPTDFTSATFWDDVYAYFAPVDIGNVYSGFPAGANQTKGAVGQPVYSPTYSLHPLAYN